MAGEQLSAKDNNPLEALMIAAETASNCTGDCEEKKSQFPALLQHASPRDTQFANELLIVFREQPSIGVKEAKNLVTTNLGLTQDNKRQILIRLRKTAAAASCSCFL